MAALTPIAGSRFDSVTGDQREVLAKFSSVANNDTWATGLGLITGVDITSGASKTMAATVSGGTVTFLVTSGPDTNTYVNVNGY